MTADPSRLVRSIAGIGFAVLLMFMQLGFKDGFIESTLKPVRALDGDVIMISSAQYTVTWAHPFPKRRLEQALALPQVVSARPLYVEQNTTIWKNASTQTSHPIQVLAFDPDEPVFVLPEINRHLEALKRPDTVLIDDRSRPFLGPARAGLETELSERAIEVIGTFAFGPDFEADGRLITSDRTFQRILQTEGASASRLRFVEIGVIRIRPGSDAQTVAAALDARLPADVVAMTKEAYLAKEEAFQTEITAVGPIFGLGVLIGFLVGILISYQIMYTELSDQLPSYATLKAMGYDNRYLRKVVLQQALFFAFAAFVPAAVLSALLYVVVEQISLIPMDVTGEILGTTGLLTATMCVISGLIALRRVLKADPAEVF